MTVIDHGTAYAVDDASKSEKKNIKNIIPGSLEYNVKAG
jgi:hypothetical protein